MMPNDINSKFNWCHWKPGAECHRNLNLRKAAVEGKTSVHKYKQEASSQPVIFFQGECFKHTHTVISTSLISYVDQMGISLYPYSLSATFTRDKAIAHKQMRTTQGKLPFTYRTFGVSGAQPQSHYSQHAGNSQHLLGRGSAPGRRRNHDELSPRGSARERRRNHSELSPFFSPPFLALYPLFLSPRSPFLFNASGPLLSLRTECGTVHWQCGTSSAAWSRRRAPGRSRSTSLSHRN